MFVNVKVANVASELFSIAKHQMESICKVGDLLSEAQVISMNLTIQSDDLYLLIL